jgi:putative transposase
MSRPRHIQGDNIKAFYVTTNTYNKFPAFADRRFAQLAMDAIFYGQASKWYYLYGFVVLPDHLHLLFSPRDRKKPDIIQGLKGYTARMINRQTNLDGPFWQAGYIDLPINTKEMAEQKLAYIERNPVKAGIVKNARDYPFSSASKHDRLDLSMMRSLFE